MSFSLSCILGFCTPCFPHHQPPKSVSTFLTPSPETYPRFAPDDLKSIVHDSTFDASHHKFSSQQLFVVMTFLTHLNPVSPYYVSLGCSYVVAYISCSLLVFHMLPENLRATTQLFQDPWASTISTSHRSSFSISRISILPGPLLGTEKLTSFDVSGVTLRCQYL